MISCQEAVRQLWDFLENDLDDDDRSHVEDHLAFCRTCCGEVEFAEELAGVIRSARDEQVPDAVTERLSAFILGLETG